MELALEVTFYLDFRWPTEVTWNAYFRWPTEVTSNAYFRWPTEVTSNAYFRGVPHCIPWVARLLLVLAIFPRVPCVRLSFGLDKELRCTRGPLQTQTGMTPRRRHRALSHRKPVQCINHHKYFFTNCTVRQTPFVGLLRAIVFRSSPLNLSSTQLEITFCYVQLRVIYVVRSYAHGLPLSGKTS